MFRHSKVHAALTNRDSSTSAARLKRIVGLLFCCCRYLQQLELLKIIKTLPGLGLQVTNILPT
jgi:hypothetical protein